MFENHLRHRESKCSNLNSSYNKGLVAFLVKEVSFQTLVAEIPAFFN